MRNNERSFTSDERAIEGLPIRLVIALVVGVASLALMLQVLDGFGGVGQTEVDVLVNDDNRTFEPGGDGNLIFTVVDENGDEIEGATVVFEPDTAQGDIYEVNLDEDQATYTIDDFPDKVNANLRADQNRGTYTIEVIPPSNSDLEDEQENPTVSFLDN